MDMYDICREFHPDEEELEVSSELLHDLSHVTNLLEEDYEVRRKVYIFLDTVRDSGVCNMHQSGYLLERHLNIKSTRAQRSCIYAWIQHKENKSSLKKLLTS